jgi:hypothetical protein
MPRVGRGPAPQHPCAEREFVLVGAQHAAARVTSQDVVRAVFTQRSMIEFMRAPGDPSEIRKALSLSLRDYRTATERALAAQPVSG